MLVPRWSTPCGVPKQLDGLTVGRKLVEQRDVGENAKRLRDDMNGALHAEIAAAEAALAAENDAGLRELLSHAAAEIVEFALVAVGCNEDVLHPVVP